MQVTSILKYTVSVSVLSLLLACSNGYKNTISGKNTTSSYQYPETLAISFSQDQPNWSVVNQAALEGKSLTEVIPEGDDINQWRQLISITYSAYFVESEQNSVQDEMQNKLQAIKATCRSHLTTQVLAENDREITYEIQMKGCGTGMLANQTQIARIVKGRTGFNSVHYAVKDPLVTASKLQEMQSLVSRAYLVN